MVNAYIGSKGLKRPVEVRVVNLKTTKSKSFSIHVDEKAKQKDHDIQKIRDLLERLLSDYVKEKGGLVLK